MTTLTEQMLALIKPGGISLEEFDAHRPEDVSKRRWGVVRGLLIVRGKARYTNRDERGTATRIEKVTEP